MAIVSINVTSESYDYLLEILGVFVQRTAAGTVEINPQLQGLIDILHAVVAGATLTGPPVKGGTATAPTQALTLDISTVATTKRVDLDAMLNRGVQSINSLNAVNRDIIVEL
jgi:hypothetical protein